ncbi:MAG: DUF1877 family protein [Deltaproteobacteria bacterium]|nr:DUF1877 family protein [Deltaproteobacteria bacterium]
MSMPVTFYALTAEQARAYRSAFDAAMKPRPVEPIASRAEDDWGDVLGATEATSTEDILEESAEVAQLDWEAFGLSFLLHRAANVVYEPAKLIDEVFGKDLGVGLNPNGTMHNQNLLSPAQVLAASTFLARFDAPALRGHFDPLEMQKQVVHPMESWNEPGMLDSLLAARDTVGNFFAHAAKAGASVVVTVAI